ncbi:MAG: carboxylesterase family protein [Marinilabiliales bacterium]|nr:carboxylesterase family protein [Marinilabiliales bacterium]
MRNLISFILICLITVGLGFTGCSPKTNQDQKPVVKTTSGDISGSIDDSIFTFKGIPYARAGRFMPPQDPDAWDGVLECNEFGPVAKQIVPWYPDSVQNEKELFTVNVWTQGINGWQKTPGHALVARRWFSCWRQQRPDDLWKSFGKKRRCGYSICKSPLEYSWFFWICQHVAPIMHNQQTSACSTL